MCHRVQITFDALDARAPAERSPTPQPLTPGLDNSTSSDKRSSVVPSAPVVSGRLFIAIIDGCRVAYGGHVHPRPARLRLTLLAACAGAAAIPTVAVAAVLPSSAQPMPGYPEHVKDFPYFATPSGRIACEYRGGRVSCTTYKGSVERGQDVWEVRARGRGRYAPIKANFPSEDLPRAKYGVTYAYKTIKCRIDKTTGIKCWNRAGHGFRVSMEKQRVF